MMTYSIVLHSGKLFIVCSSSLEQLFALNSCGISQICETLRTFPAPLLPAA